MLVSGRSRLISRGYRTRLINNFADIGAAVSLFRLDQTAEALLLEQPESGLGYQVVLLRGSPLVVFNATTAIPLSELRSRRFTAEDYFLLSGNPETMGPQESLSFEGSLDVVFSQFDPELRSSEFGLSFSETAIEPSDVAIPMGVPQSYYRYSAYYRDKRLDSRGNFLPGTYATTYPDMHFVPSGFAAVGRYALPNPASARFVFGVVTFDRPTLIGTATPNFGQAGGGVEVLFGNGARNRPGTSFQINLG